MKNKMVAAILGFLISTVMLTGCSQVGMVRNTGATDGSKFVQPVKSVQNIDRTEAENVIKHMINIDYSKYKIDLISSDLEYKGQEYYQFLISDSAVSIEPSIIVSKDDGEIYCYYPDHTTTEVYQDQVFKSKC